MSVSQNADEIWIERQKQKSFIKIVLLSCLNGLIKQYVDLIMNGVKQITSQKFKQAMIHNLFVFPLNSVMR